MAEKAQRKQNVLGGAMILVVATALVSALISLELGEEIPAELYEVVAKVLAWVYRLDKEAAGGPFGGRFRP